MKQSVELVDIGGAKQKHDVSPKHKWEILDIVVKSHKYTNVDLNGGTPFPIADNMITAYYASMVFEHISLDNLGFVLSEVYRTLQPNGLLRVVVPDITIPLKLYCSKDAKKLLSFKGPSRPGYFPETPLGYVLHWVLTPPEGKIKSSGRSGHQNMFDEPTLRWWLEKAGFRNIIRMSYGNCSEWFIGKDSISYKDWALYMEATK